MQEFKATGRFPIWQHLLHQSYKSDTMQMNWTTSHNSVLYSVICFHASKFGDIPHNKAIFKLKLICSPEKMQAQESESQPPPRTDQRSMAPLQPHLPSLGKIRDTSVNTLRHTNKRTAKTYSLIRSLKNHFAWGGTERVGFSSVLLWPWSSFKVRVICPLWSWSLLHA